MKEQIPEQNIKITESVVFMVNGLLITAQFSDTVEHFAFRLCHGTINGKWIKHYGSLVTLEVGKRKFIMGTGYGLLPTNETPFELVEGIKQ